MNSTSNVNLKEKDIRFLCLSALEIFKEESMLLEIEGPLAICGKNIITKVTSMDNFMI